MLNGQKASGSKAHRLECKATPCWGPGRAREGQDLDKSFRLSVKGSETGT